MWKKSYFPCSIWTLINKPRYVQSSIKSVKTHLWFSIISLLIKSFGLHGVVCVFSDIIGKVKILKMTVYFFIQYFVQWGKWTHLWEPEWAWKPLRVGQTGPADLPPEAADICVSPPASSGPFSSGGVDRQHLSLTNRRQERAAEDSRGAVRVLGVPLPCPRALPKLPKPSDPLNCCHQKNSCGVTGAEPPDQQLKRWCRT